MTTGLVLSGGGARGSFEMGAVKCLYIHFDVRPDVLIGTSVGAINAAKLAEAESRAEQLTAMHDLETIWRSRSYEQRYVRRRTMAR
jgi:predicted acylesterase/phospholipase RssA